MRTFPRWVSVTMATAPAFLVLVATVKSYGSGVESGSRGLANQAAQMMPSCGGCHSSNPGGPTVSLVPTKHALQWGESITVTTGATGVSGTNGGFLCEATAGSFTAGSNSRVNSSTISISHSNNNVRSWSFGFTAPNATGLVELYSVVNATNGSGTSGDSWAFHGFDPTSTSSTPVRLFVLPQGVTDLGPGCGDGYGNQSVLGASATPTVGNQSFAVSLHGATPASLGFLLVGFQGQNTPLAGLGLPGCTAYTNAFTTLSNLTSSGNAQRAEGSVSFPIPIPNQSSFQGLSLFCQGAYIDPTSASTLGRTFPVAFSNGIQVTIQ